MNLALQSAKGQERLCKDGPSRAERPAEGRSQKGMQGFHPIRCATGSRGGRQINLEAVMGQRNHEGRLLDHSLVLRVKTDDDILQGHEGRHSVPLRVLHLNHLVAASLQDCVRLITHRPAALRNCEGETERQAQPA